MLVVVLLQSDAFARYLIGRAAGEAAMQAGGGRGRCCDASFSSARVGFRPLRIDISDFKLMRHDPAGERGGSALLIEVPLLTLGIDSGAFGSDRAAIEWISVGEGIARIEAKQDGAQERWEIDLAGAPLALFARAFAGARNLAGIASGTIALEGNLFAPDAAVLDLAIAGASIEIKRFDIRGQVLLAANLIRGASGLAGDFAFDVENAEVEVVNAYNKPMGTAGSISGRIASGEGGRIEAMDLNYRAEKARVHIEL